MKDVLRYGEVLVNVGTFFKRHVDCTDLRRHGKRVLIRRVNFLAVH
jgi:hypothetical protein